MKDFSKVKFKWTFRDYQQAVLDNSQKHLKDKRIHIVAAPGSGKTILVLSLSAGRMHLRSLCRRRSQSVSSGVKDSLRLICPKQKTPMNIFHIRSQIQN